MKCVNCGTELEPDDQFCRECGEPAPEEHTTSPRHCTNCGTELDPDDRFCGECGQPVTTAGATQTCPNCNADIVPGTKFCSQCGYDVRTTTPHSGVPAQERSVPGWLWFVGGAVGVLAVVGLALGIAYGGPRLFGQAGAPTVTPTQLVAAAPSATATATPTQPATETPAPTETPTVEPTDTPTEMPVPTDTPEPTETPAATTTSEADTTETSTPTPTATATDTPTETPEPTQTTAPAAQVPSNTVDFETAQTWERGDQPYGSFERSTDEVHDGEYAAVLSYDFPGSDNDFVVFLRDKPLDGTPNALRAWVYGDGEGHYLNLWIRDSDGQTWQVPLGTVTHTGWKRMTGAIDTDQDWPWTTISGPDDGDVDYPIRLAGIVLDDESNSYSGSGKLYIDDITAVELDEPLSAATPSPEATATTAAPAISGRIVFPVYDQTNGYYNVYIANADGSDRYLLAEHRRQPEFGPGGRVAVNGEGGNTDSLWVMNADGSGRFEVGTHPEDSQPTWSPAGDKIAMSSQLQGGDDEWRIYIYQKLSKDDPQDLKYGYYEIRGRYPTWLDDGRIVFTGCNYWSDGSVCGLYAVSSEGGQPAALTRGGTNDLSADDAGKQLVFMRLDGGNWEVYRTTTSGGSPVNLTNNAAADGLPAWSPDGEWIAFVSNRSGNWAIWAMQPDGSGPRKLFDLNGPLRSDWPYERISWAP